LKRTTSRRRVLGALLALPAGAALGRLLGARAPEPEPVPYLDEPVSLPGVSSSSFQVLDEPPPGVPYPKLDPATRAEVEVLATVSADGKPEDLGIDLKGLRATPYWTDEPIGTVERLQLHEGGGFTATIKIHKGREREALQVFENGVSGADFWYRPPDRELDGLSETVLRNWREELDAATHVRARVAACAAGLGIPAARFDEDLVRRHDIEVAPYG